MQEKEGAVKSRGSIKSRRWQLAMEKSKMFPLKNKHYSITRNFDDMTRQERNSIVDYTAILHNI